MPKSTSRQFGNTSKSVTPNSYHTKSITITTQAGDEIDIKDLVQKYSISESLSSPTIEVNLVIVDAANFLDDHKLQGDEKIVLKVQRSPLNDDEQERTNKSIEVYVANIHGYVRNTQGKQFYQLTCVSKHMYLNQSKNLTRAFSGSIGTLVNNICTKDLKIQPFNINTSTKGSIKGIYPSIKPLDAINWLMRNAYDNGTPYYFYETLKEGVIFDSFYSIAGKEVYSEYDNASFFRYEPGTEEAYEEERKRIKKITSPLNVSRLAAIGDGCFSATTHVLDIGTKTYTKTPYEYKDAKQTKLNTYKPFNNTDIINQELTNAKESKNFYISSNTGAFDGFANYHRPTVETIAKAESQLHSLEYMTQEILINGDFDLSCGSVVALKIAKATDLVYAQETGIIDKHLSGKYVIVSIKHNFEEQYTQRVLLKKDSSEVDLNA